MIEEEICQMIENIRRVQMLIPRGQEKKYGWRKVTADELFFFNKTVMMQFALIYYLILKCIDGVMKYLLKLW